MFWKLLGFGYRRSKSIFSILAVYLILSIIYFHLPWSVRMSVHEKVPQLNTVLMKSGYTVMSAWDELALLGRDASAPVTGKYRGDRTYGGFPEQPGLNLLDRLTRIDNIGYSVGYCEALDNPAWAAYRIFDVPKLRSGKRPGGFKTDNRTRSRVTHEDYSYSGYDRGHLAPNYGIGTRYGYDAQKETFFMSNIIPQTPAVNRGIWKDLEMRVAKRYGRYFGEVWVVTGPVFAKKHEKMDSKVPIPDYYFKIIADRHGDDLRVLAFLIEKDCPPYTRVRKRLVSVDQIEDMTGLDFFPKLDAATQNRLESDPATRLWPWIGSAVKYYF
jgi:endonuclease G